MAEPASNKTGTAQRGRPANVRLPKEQLVEVANTVTANVLQALNPPKQHRFRNAIGRGLRSVAHALDSAADATVDGVKAVPRIRVTVKDPKPAPRKRANVSKKTATTKKS